MHKHLATNKHFPNFELWKNALWVPNVFLILNDGKMPSAESFLNFEGWKNMWQVSGVFLILKDGKMSGGHIF